MTPLNNRKKEIERWFLDTARERSTLFPVGEIENSEEPDFEIHTATGSVGIEVTELLRKGEGPFPPVKEETFHREVIEIAKAEYYRTPDAIPLRVLVYFWNREGGTRNKREMAQELVEFVQSHPAGTYERRDTLPKGLSVVHIDSTGDDWTHGESGVTNLAEIFEQLASSISAKNKLLPRYRARLPHSPIWLLIYSGFSVPRGLPIPYGLDERTYPFDFDRVLFFAQLSGAVVEIRREVSREEQRQQVTI
jgi:hypothetical protein